MSIIKLGSIKVCFYLCAILLIVIPTTIALISDTPFSSTFSSTMISTAIGLVILGKLITIFEKRKEMKSLAPDIGAIIGLAIVLIIF